MDLTDVVTALRAWVAKLEPKSLAGPQALAALDLVCEAERLCAAARISLAPRVEETKVWAAEGSRSPAEFLAKRAGTSVSSAEQSLRTGALLETATGTADALRAGLLSEPQVTELARASAAVPAAEGHLLDAARRGSFKQLKDECRRVRLSVQDDDRYARIKRERFFKTWTDDEGAACGQYRTTPDSGARIAAAIQKVTDRIFRDHHDGDRESPQAYAVDALEELVCSSGGTGTKQKLVINTFVDYPQLIDGQGSCDLDGLGPVPVEAIKEWEGDRYLRLLVTDGKDIRAVTRTTRYIDADQRATVLARERGTCCIQGCGQTRRLQLDHHRRFADGGETSTANVKPLCPFHHRLKDAHGWNLISTDDGAWHLEPP